MLVLLTGAARAPRVARHLAPSRQVVGVDRHPRRRRIAHDAGWRAAALLAAGAKQRRVRGAGAAFLAQEGDIPLLDIGVLRNCPLDDAGDDLVPHIGDHRLDLGRRLNRPGFSEGRFV